MAWWQSTLKCLTICTVIKRGLGQSFLKIILTFLSAPSFTINFQKCRKKQRPEKSRTAYNITGKYSLKLYLFFFNHVHKHDLKNWTTKTMATSWDKSCRSILIQIHPRHKKENKKRMYCRIFLVGDEILNQTLNRQVVGSIFTLQTLAESIVENG